MKESFFKFIQKYHITKWKIVVLSVLFLLFVLRFLIQGNVLIKPVLLIFDIYANILILNTKLILYFLNQHLIFDFNCLQFNTHFISCNISAYNFGAQLGLQPGFNPPMVNCNPVCKVLLETIPRIERKD